jgi:hypothetical protein
MGEENTIQKNTTADLTSPQSHPYKLACPVEIARYSTGENVRMFQILIHPIH